MKKKRMKRRFPLLLGAMLIFCGIGMVYSASRKNVEIIINGESRSVTIRGFRVIDALRKAKVAFNASDRIRPGLNERIHNGSRISLDRAVNVRLDPGHGMAPFSFISHERFGGNILLDAGILLFPGDRIIWENMELRPDFNLAGIGELDFQLERADSFTLVTEDFPEGKAVYGSGDTVFDALLSAGINVNKSMLVIPDGDRQFESGMTISIFPLRELQVTSNGKMTPVISAGATVGDALARAGIPLMGSDESIPASWERLPADGRITIVHAEERFSMSAEVVRRTTDWSANDTLDLDDTRLISEGKDGLKGTYTRTRSENGVIVLNETSPEIVLAEPVNEKREYGTKINIRTLDTPEGPLTYYRAVKVYATSYSPCRSGTDSCITGTASGMKVQKGVAAVTSSWYNKFGGQTVYVPDYGKAVIADVGGGIPGRNWIDLAYGDDDFEGWSRETTLYFLTPVPADMVWVLQ